MNHIFEKIILLVIAIGILTAIALYIIDTNRIKKVYIVNTVDTEVRNKVEVSITDEVDVNLNDVLGTPIGTHATYVDEYGIQHWGIDVIEY